MNSHQTIVHQQLPNYAFLWTFFFFTLYNQKPPSRLQPVFFDTLGFHNAIIGLKMEESGNPENIFSNISADFSDNKGYVKNVVVTGKFKLKVWF